MNQTTPSHTPDRRSRPHAMTIGACICALTTTIALTACQQDSASGDPTNASADQSPKAPPTTSAPPAPPSSAGPSKSTSKTPTPAPARADEVKEAQAAYVKYVTALIAAQKTYPPPAKPPKSLLAMTTGPESKWLRKAFTAAKEKDAFIRGGSVKVTMGDETGYSVTEIDTIKFKACQDGETIDSRIGREEKEVKQGRWYLNEVTMHHKSDKSGKPQWLVYGESEQDHNPNKSCEYK